MRALAISATLERLTYRSKFKIVNDILHTILESQALQRRKITTIAHSAGLAYWITVKYLRVLINRDLLRFTKGPEPYLRYEITEKGIRYLQLFVELETDLKPESDSSLSTCC